MPQPNDSYSIHFCVNRCPTFHNWSIGLVLRIAGYDDDLGIWVASLNLHGVTILEHRLDAHFAIMKLSLNAPWAWWYLDNCQFDHVFCPFPFELGTGTL